MLFRTSYNNANAATKYPHIDEKIQERYTKYSTVINQNKSADMYKRFLRWSTDRIGKRGMVVFVSNNAFLDAKADDGVRRALYSEFDHVYVVNLRGNARLAGEARRKEKGNVFGSQARVGIAIYFLIKTGEGVSDIQYAEVDDYMSQNAKLEWLKNNTISTVSLDKIRPDKDDIWLNQTNNDFDELVPALPRTHNESIFAESTLGVSTNKDQWIYDLDKNSLVQKIKFYISVYNDELIRYGAERPNKMDMMSWIDKKIKWSGTTVQNLARMCKITYSQKSITNSLYRPFVRTNMYYDKVIVERLRRFPNIFKNSKKNRLIGFSNPKTNVPFNQIATDLIIDLGCIDGTQVMPIWRYDDNNKKTSNVTDYGLELFRTHYKNKKIIGDDIFYYTYAIFNDPKYIKKYKFNLQRNFPRIPLAKDFKTWSDIGKKLFDLHCKFNTAKEYDLTRVDKYVKKNRTRLKLKRSTVGKNTQVEIVIDDATVLKDIPKEVLEYKIGSKNPLEWILEFYKETKNQIKKDSSNDKTVRDRFNTYRFVDYKEDVIVLLRRVTTVCVETMNLRKKLERMEWGAQPKLTFTKLNDAKPKTIKRPKSLPGPTPLQETLDGVKQERLPL